MPSDTSRNVNDSILRVAMWALGGHADYLSSASRWMLYSYDSIVFMCYGMRIPIDTPDTIEKANNKILSRDSMSAQHLPVVPWEIIDATRATPHTSNKLWVLKPVAGMKGDGVFVGLSSSDLQQYAGRLGQQSRYLLLEPYIVGRKYRFLVLDGQVIGAYWAEPPVLCGDGIHTVRELIETGGQPLLPYRSSIPHDAEVEYALGQQGLQLISVPPTASRFSPTFTVNLSRGASWKKANLDVMTREMDIAIQAAKCVGLRLAGIDMMITERGEMHILETNPSPGLLGVTLDDKASPPQAAGYLPVFTFGRSTPQAAGNPPRRD